MNKAAFNQAPAVISVRGLSGAVGITSPDSSVLVGIDASNDVTLEVGGLAFVPYLGAISDVDLGIYSITASTYFGDGSNLTDIDLSSVVPYSGAITDLDMNGHSITAYTYYGDGSNLSGITAGAAGSDGQIQYNSSGNLAADGGLTWDGFTLGIGNQIAVNGAGFAFLNNSGVYDTGGGGVTTGAAIFIQDSSTYHFGFYPNYADGRSVIVMGNPSQSGAFDFFNYRSFGGATDSLADLVLTTQGNDGFSERLRVTGGYDPGNFLIQNSNVGIMNISPAYPLDVGGAINNTAGYYYNSIAPVADGTYTMGIGVTQNGTITVGGGAIQVIQEAM